MHRCASYIPISISTSLNKGVYLWKEMCVFGCWVCALSPTDNQVPEHCQDLICFPVGMRGHRAGSLSPLPISSSLTSVGASERLHLLPWWVTLPLSPPRPLETI